MAFLQLWGCHAYFLIYRKKVSICAIIAAAGCGKRMGSSIHKQFLQIENKPILVHTLEKFRQSTLIDSIIIVVPKDWYRYVLENIVDKFRISKVNKIVIGGATRQESVHKALKAVSEDISTVVIHDAVRPLISLNLLNKVILKGKETGAAVLAVPIHESIKKVSDNQIEQSLERDSIWLVQTPQVFKKDLIFHAYQQAFFNSITATDDSELVEFLGYPIHVVEGSRSNIKITTKEDLDLAKFLIRKSHKVRGEVPPEIDKFEL
jgi:2-C-methyl-D-erythritol 4-phosphate cytidylyltransferase